MPASDEFKKALRSGDLPEAFVMAMGKATELNITTKVIKADGTVDEAYNSAQCLETRLDILSGTIENRVGEDFVGTGKYSELQAFHQQQVALGNRKIQENFQSLQELFRLLVTLQQYNRLTNAEQPLDLTFLEVPSQKLPPERVITTLQEQASILESLQGGESSNIEKTDAENKESSEGISSPTNGGETVSSNVAKISIDKAERKEQTTTTSSPPSQANDTPTQKSNNLWDGAIATGVVAATAAVAKSVTSEAKPDKPEDGESLDFLDSFAALDLDDAPAPLMPVSDVEIDDWETPTDMSPAERLSQMPTDTYIPTLSDFDHDDDDDGEAGLDDFLEADLDDLLGGGEASVVEDDSFVEPTEPTASETLDDALLEAEAGAIAPSAPEALDVEDIDAAAEENDDFDVDELPDFSDDSLDALLADSFSEVSSPSALESSDTDDVVGDTDDFDADELPDFSDDSLDALLADREADSGAIAASDDAESIARFDEFADISEDDLPDDVMDDLLHEPEETDDDDSEITAISFGPKSTFPGISDIEDSDEEAILEPKASFGDVLEEEELITPDDDVAPVNVADLTDISHGQGEVALEAGDMTTPQDATIPSEAIAHVEAELTTNELLVAASAMTPEVTEQALQETFNQSQTPATEEKPVPQTHSEPAETATTVDISTIDDSELLSFIDENWQLHPDVMEITSLDAETDDEPVLLQPLSEEELATLEEVEDTDWLSSTVDNDWEPLNLSSDDTKGLENFSLILHEEELAVDSEMASLESAVGEETSVISAESDTWSAIGNDIGDDIDSPLEATAALPTIDLPLDDLNIPEAEETSVANREDSGAIADDMTDEISENIATDSPIEADDLSAVSENLNTLEQAGAVADLDLDLDPGDHADSEDWSEAATDLDSSVPSETSLDEDSEAAFADLDESSEHLNDLEMETARSGDDGVDEEIADNDIFAGIDASELADLSDDQLDNIELDEKILTESPDSLASDIDEPEIDPFATDNLASMDLEMFAAEADLELENIEDDMELELSMGNLGKLTSPDPLLLDGDSFDELGIEPDLDLDVDDVTHELATPVFETEPDPFAELGLGDEELETTGLDNLDLLDVEGFISGDAAGTSDDLDFDPLNLDIDRLDNLDFDSAAMDVDGNDDNPLLEFGVSDELDTSDLPSADDAMAMDVGEFDQEIFDSLTELDQATEHLETGSLDFNSQVLLDDLDGDAGINAESTAFLGDDGESDFDLDAISLDELGGLAPEVSASQSSDLSDAENFSGLDLELDTTEALPELPDDGAIATEKTLGGLSEDDDWPNFDLNLESDEPLAEFAGEGLNDLDDTPIDLDFDLGDLNLPEMASMSSDASTVSATDELDWDQLSTNENEAANASDDSDAGWDIFGDQATTSAQPGTAATEETIASSDDDWAIAGLDSLDDLSDNDLSSLGDFDLDALELDDDENDDSDLDLFKNDESGNLNPFLDPSV